MCVCEFVCLYVFVCLYDSFCVCMYALIHSVSFPIVPYSFWYQVDIQWEGFESIFRDDELCPYFQRGRCRYDAKKCYKVHVKKEEVSVTQLLLSNGRYMSPTEEQVLR